MPKTEEEIRQRVAENLTNMRKQKGLTQEELAKHQAQWVAGGRGHCRAQRDEGPSPVLPAYSEQGLPCALWLSAPCCGVVSAL